MSHKTQIIKNLHKIFREDPYINNLLGTGGERLDNLSMKSEIIEKEYWFDTMSAIGIALMEEQMAYRCMGRSLEQKRIELEARWKTSGKCDLDLLQTIADTWINGDAKVSFKDAHIMLEFKENPDDIYLLTTAIEAAKPAHIPIGYRYVLENIKATVNSGYASFVAESLEYTQDVRKFREINNKTNYGYSTMVSDNVEYKQERI